jgi:hypothetical protein
VTSATIGIDALRAMRSDRRKHRVEDMDWFEALYRVYLAAFLGLGAIFFLSGLVGDAEFTRADLVNIHTHSPHVVGLAAALAVFIGLRSGANGGPLAVEDAEVRHVLMAPISHAQVLRHPAIQRLRTFAFAGALAGGVANQLLGRRVPNHPSLGLFALYGAIAGGIIGVLFVVSALLAHGLGIARWLTTAIASILLGWQVAVTVGDTNVAGPFDVVGSIALGWSRVNAIDAIGVLAVVLLTAVSISLVGRFSLEALARRSALVSQMKFAVTLQDVRTVVLLRRQLSQEHMRVKPWMKVPRVLRRDVVVGRGLRSMMHFPLRRIIRMKLLAIAAAGAMVLAWRGTTPMVVPAGLALFVLGLDVVEPLSQEVDQPDRTDALPVERGLIMTKHLIVPAIASLVFLPAGVFTVLILEPGASSVGYAVLLGIIALLGGVAGATINSVKGAPDPIGGANQGLALPPEVSGMTTVIRSGWPPVVSIIACLPVLALRYGVENNSDILGNTLRATGGVVILLVLVAGWVRQRDAILAYFRTLKPPTSSPTTITESN